MSKAVKGAGGNQAAPGPDLPFEAALQKLESIVESMEGEDLPLETLLARFEEGSRLVKVCQAKLAEAELKIQQLEKDAGGEPVLRPLAPPPETLEA
ncbi:MAG: exodeoxyribonuclease VII small subunit [Chloroflexi bacterium]|nr:exodeoxyribonuclease VII small subunit [Chloroflexota bacterium]